MASSVNSSVVWNFFNKLELDRSSRIKSVSCNLCGKKYKTSGNTTNLAAHLKGKHAFAYAQLTLKSKFKSKNKINSEDVNNNTRTNLKSHFGLGSTSTNSTNISIGGCGQNEGDEPNILSPDPNISGFELDLASSQNEAQTSRDSLGSTSTSTYVSYSISKSNANSTSTSTISKCRQQTLSDVFDKVASYDDGGQRHTEMTKALVYMIIKDNLPFASVEKEGLRKYIQVACPRYKLPSPFKLTGLVEQRYKTAKAILASILKDVKYVSLSSDIVTVTNSTRSFLIVTVHFMNASAAGLEFDASLCSCCLTAENITESHTAENIKQLFETITAEFQIDKSRIVNISTDNGSNIAAAVRLFFGESRRIPCAAHLINIIIDGVLKGNSDFLRFAEHIKSIVTYFKHSVNASDQLRAEQQAEGKKEGQILKLVQSVSTRWNSCLDMMQRFLTLFSTVAKVLASMSTRRRNIPDMVPVSQLNFLKDLVVLLSPFKTVTEELSGEKYVTASLVIPLTNLIKQEIEQCCPCTDIGTFVKNDLLKGIEERLLPLEHNIFLATATVLDPRFKKMYFTSALAVANTITDLSKKVVEEHKRRGNISPEVRGSSANEPQGETSYIWSRHEQMLLRNSSNGISGTSIGSMPAELKQYLDQPNISRTSNPLKFWVDSRHFIPALSEIALKYLISSATSVASERVASTVNVVVPDSRSCQTAEHIKERVFLKTLNEKYWHL